MSEYKGYTEAMGKATAKYRKANLERISLDVKKGKREEYRAKAEAKGMSLQSYIISLIEADN